MLLRSSWHSVGRRAPGDVPACVPIPRLDERSRLADQHLDLRGDQPWRTLDMARRRTGYPSCSPGPHPPGELTPRSPVPELTHLVPIIGAPDYGALLAARAAGSGLGALRAPHWPRALDALVRAGDPVHAPPGAWAGKRVLAVCGGRDELVPPTTGGTEALVARLRGAGVDAALQVDAEAGHEVTPQMVGWVAQWLSEKALRPTPA
jgi:hypothetical protein